MNILDCTFLKSNEKLWAQCQCCFCALAKYAQLLTCLYARHIDLAYKHFFFQIQPVEGKYVPERRSSTRQKELYVRVCKRFIIIIQIYILWRVAAAKKNNMFLRKKRKYIESVFKKKNSPHMLRKIPKYLFNLKNNKSFRTVVLPQFNIINTNYKLAGQLKFMRLTFRVQYIFLRARIGNSRMTARVSQTHTHTHNRLLYT